MALTLLWLIFSIVFADDTVSTTTPNTSTTVLTCQQTCENYYQKNPDARPKSMDGVCVDGAVSKVTKHISPIDCMYGAWEGVLTLPEKLKAYGALVENVGDHIRKNIQAHRKFIAECAQSIECKRQLGRSLQNFSARKADGTWFVPDSEVDTYVKNLDIVSLLDQVSVHKRGMESYCSTLLYNINQEVRREGHTGYEFAKARYEKLLKKDIECVGAMGLTPPEPPPVSEDQPRQSWSEWFEQKGIQLQCYPPGKISELWCYQIADFVVDPLTLTGTGALGGKIALKVIERAGLKKLEKAAAARVFDSFKGAFTFSKKNEFGIKTITVENGGKNMGHLTYTKKGSEIHVLSMKSAEKESGVGTAAFSEMLRDNPNAKVIYTKFSDDNHRILRDLTKGGMSCIEAMKLTPAYKIRAKFGWTKIVNAECPNEYQLEIEDKWFTLEVAKP